MKMNDIIIVSVFLTIEHGGNVNALMDIEIIGRKQTNCYDNVPE